MNEKNNKTKMPSKKAIIIIVVAVFVCVGLFFAGKALYEAGKQKSKDDIAANTEKSLEIVNYLSEEHTPEEIEKYLFEQFKGLSKKECTSIVDLYIYGTYQYAMQQQMSDDETNKISAAILEDGTIDYSLIEDEELKQKLLDLKNSHVVVRYVNQGLFYDIDYGYFADTYKDYLTEDYYRLISLFEEEKTIDYCDGTEQKLYTDIVENRLDDLYSMMQEFPESTVYPTMESTYKFYEAVYLGAYGQDYIFNQGSVKGEIYDAYKTYVDKTKDPELKQFLQELIASYTENNLIRTVPTFEKIKEFCGKQLTDN